MASIKEIDAACRAGQFVFVDNRQRVMGACQVHKGVSAPYGAVWVNLWKTGYWETVPVASIIITTETVKEQTMATRKKAEQEVLPGVKQKKIGPLESLAKKYDEAKEPFAVARDFLKEAKTALIKMMHQKIEPNAEGELVYKRGLVRIVVKPSKEKLDVSIGEDNDDGALDPEVDIETEDEE